MSYIHSHGGKSLSPYMVLLFALTGGLAVGNLYWAQPLLDVIADAFSVSSGHAGLLVTVTQLGYALGILLIVPLGDTLNRRLLIPVILLCSAIALIGCALSSDFNMLCAFIGLLGLTTVGGQILTPFISELARPEQRGKIVGTIVSGMLTGILLSRTLSGFFGEYIGWRSIYLFAAVLTLILSGILLRILPGEAPKHEIHYIRLIQSVFRLAAVHSTVRKTLLIGFFTFMVFSAFWTGLTFLLSSPVYAFTPEKIGMTGIAGLAGALVARRAGLLHDRGYSSVSTGAALVMAAGSLLITGPGFTHLSLIIVAIIFFDMAVQTINVLNQTRLLGLEPANRSRINTAFVTTNFIGGALGSSLAGLLWDIGGWATIAWSGTGILGLTFLFWLGFRKSL